MSDILRLFVAAISLQSDRVVISDEPFHHLCHVLRAKPGAELLLMDGAGLCCRARLETVSKREATAQILERSQQSEGGIAIHLLQALPKGDKFDLILQKGAELGIRSFHPVLTEHVAFNLKPERIEKRLQRWRRILCEAARQSRRPLLPQLEPPKQLDQLLADDSSELKLALWEDGAQALETALPSQPPKQASILIGPEGGFSADEIERISAAGFKPVHLGPRILRTETAGLAIAPILQYLYGDWRQAPGALDTP
ncbi:MAG: 16S rRNA (uracil(1498)-N(3))-methyltransferase [Desulfuromonadales bacterium]|nr:16S rRNA (uracil(1498)-N(3))-methyltransferase [Desulfuromonadales bacterium]